MRALPLVASLALLAGCAAPPPADGNATGPGDTVDLAMRFVHEHAAFALWLAGERVSFAHPDYDLQRVRNMTAHLHVQNPGGEHAIHVEGEFPAGVHDVTLGQFFAVHGLRFGNGTLTLDTRDAHNGTTWNDTAALRWQVWLRPAGGAWAPAPDGPGLVLRDMHRVLVTLAPPGATAADLDAQFRSVPYLDGRGSAVRSGEP